LRPLLCAAAAAAACWAALPSPASFAARSFVAAPALFRRRSDPAARTCRRFFEKLNPDYWRKENFICEALDSYLPPAKKGALLKVVEIEPEDARYWVYLKPLDKGYYIEEVSAVGSTIDDMDDGALGRMKEAATSIGAKCNFVAWRKSHWPFGVQKGSIDIMFIADGTIKRLGPRLENALRQARLSLKKQGRFFFIANEEDEKCLRALMENDFNGRSVMDQFGFKIVTSVREFGLSVGYMQKQQKSVPISLRDEMAPKPSRPKRPRAY